MKYLVMFVIDDLDKCPAVLEAWEELGVTGITILESTGLGRIRQLTGYRDDLPLMPSIRNLLQSREEHHRTLFTLVKSEAAVDQLINTAQDIVGDLSQPNKGVIFVMPVLRVVGIQGWQDDEEA